MEKMNVQMEVLSGSDSDNAGDAPHKAMVNASDGKLLLCQVDTKLSVSTPHDFPATGSFTYTKYFFCVY